MKKIIILLAFFLVISSSAYALDVEKRNDYFRKGQRAQQQGDYDKALEYYEKVVEIDSNFAPVYNALGLTYTSTGSELSDIIWFYNIAVDIDPNYTEVYDNMCSLYYTAGHYDEAEKSCLKAVSSRPNYLKPKLSLAWIYLYGKKDPYSAIHYFKEVLEKVKHPRIYYGLGVAYSMSNDRPMVLEIITLLRGMNEDELAFQLEDSIRDDYSPREVEEKLINESRPGQIVSAGPKQTRSTGPVSEVYGSGNMRVRLKGKLENLPQPSVKHPGSL